MEMRFSPVEIKIMLESNPLKSRILVRRLAVFYMVATFKPMVYPSHLHRHRRRRTRTTVRPFDTAEFSCGNGWLAGCWLAGWLAS